jgi:hypothetical protein
LLSGGKLSLQQVAPYLEAKQRSAESLLAAFRATGDQTLLREALRKSPADPRVLFTAYFAFKNELSSAERRQWLEAFKQSAPDNALANYLSAQAYFKAGAAELAAREVAAASRQSKYHDYLSDAVRSAEEAYAAAGLSVIDAKTVAACVSMMPHLVELRDLGQSLGGLAKQYRQADDEAAAQAVFQMGAALGRRVGEPAAYSSIIHGLVGMAIERKVLDAMDPASPYDSAGRTVQDRLNECAQQRKTIQEVQDKGGYQMLQSLSEQDQLAFFERLEVSGELAALRWAQDRRGNR